MSFPEGHCRPEEVSTSVQELAAMAQTLQSLYLFLTEKTGLKF